MAKYLIIPDKDYSQDSWENLLLAITKLKDNRGLRVVVEPRTIWFQEGPVYKRDNMGWEING